MGGGIREQSDEKLFFINIYIWSHTIHGLIPLNMKSATAHIQYKQVVDVLRK